jgi:2-phosphosulfolactate phosphatase
VAHTTSAGTQGIVNAVNATRIITGSFVNAHAIVRYIKKEQARDVSLVCMGYSADSETEEDTFCAEYIHDLLIDRKPDFKKMKEIIRETSGKRFFLEQNQQHSPVEDFDLCLQPGKFNFVLQATKEQDDIYSIRRVDC